VFLLETSRLLLRPFRDGDAAAFAAYRSDPLVARYQGWDAPYPLEQATAFVASMTQVEPGRPGAWFQAAIERRADGAMLGDCAFQVLADEPRQAQIGCTLAREHQGQGVAAEAVSRLVEYLFADLGLHRVIGVCDLENQASRRLLERLGFQLEGVFRENVWFKGAWGSECLYATLRRDREEPR
jgi:RimJ/RimL family protein N-acetyltransferase